MDRRADNAFDEQSPDDSLFHFLSIAIRKKDLKAFAKAYGDSFNAQIRMFPAMVDDEINAVIDRYKDQVLAWKLAGAGGGGYLILVSEKPVKGAMKVKVRRKDSSL